MIIEILKRLFLFIITFLVLAQFGFIILYYSPDAPLTPYSFSKAYLFFLQHLFTADIGFSFKPSYQLFTEIRLKLAVTFEIILLALFFSAFVALPLGIYIGRRIGRWQAKLFHILSFIISSSSIIWIAILCTSHTAFPEFVNFETIQQTINTKTGFLFIDIWLTVPPTERYHYLLNTIGYLSLPASIISVYLINITLYFLSSSTAEVIRQNYIKVAMSRGLSHFKITIRHILPNALITIIPNIILHAPYFFLLTMIIEIIFNIPGFGSWILFSYQNQDMINIVASIIVISLLILAINLVSHMIGMIVNPFRYKDWYVSQ